MPELPEVETIVRGLKEKIINCKIIDAWTDIPKNIKKPKTFSDFLTQIKNKKIENIYRLGKNIIFELSDNYILLIHQKLTGHLLYGKWEKDKNGKFVSKIPGPLKDDPQNNFLHLILFLDNGFQIALSDLRKFAKIILLKKEEFYNLKEIKNLGPDPLDKNFTFEKFKERIFKKKRGKIKKILMDQNIIAGIGNIYSDEILWRAKIHPNKDISQLSEKELKDIYQIMKEVLLDAIILGGESISDFRNIFGKKGNFDKMRKVYRREGENCERCNNKIKRIKIGGRSSYYCPYCQKL
jgi:formamidopyrimidine-DNA glycosylase